MLPPTFEQKELRPFRSHQHVHLNFHSDVSFMLYSDCVGVRRAYPYKKYGYRGYMYMNIYTSSLFHGFCPYVGLSLLKQPWGLKRRRWIIGTMKTLSFVPGAVYEAYKVVYVLPNQTKPQTKKKSARHFRFLNVRCWSFNLAVVWQSTFNLHMFQHVTCELYFMNVFLPLKGRGGWEHIKLCISPFSLPTLRLVPSLSRPGEKHQWPKNQNRSRSLMRQSDSWLALRSERQTSI